MASPSSVKNGDNQSLDSLYAADGTPRLKRAVGSKAAGSLSTEESWAGSATHTHGATLQVGDGVSLAAGVDYGGVVTPLLVDSSGVLQAALSSGGGSPLSGYTATSSGAAEALSISVGSVGCDGVLVKADPDNAEDVWVGGYGLTADKSPTAGFRLAPGESMGVPVNDLSYVFIRRGGSVDVGVYWLLQVH